MPSITRRGLLALGGTGAAGVVLGACANESDPRAEGRDVALLETALAQERALGEVYRAGGASGEQASAIKAFAKSSAGRATEITRLLEDAGGEPPTDSGSSAAAPTEAAMAAILAYRAAAGPLSTAELRGTAIAFAAAVAAELAALAGFEGEEQVPYAFVTGDEEPPYDPDGDPTAADAQDSEDSSSDESGTDTAQEGE